MSICSLLEIEYPIIQGAMARISTHELVSAVSESGGLGVLASAGLTPEELTEEIRLVKEKTDKPFAVNLMLQDPNVPAHVDIIIKEGVKVVTTGAGSPKHYIPSLKEAGVKVIPVIASVRHALKMAELQVDALIVEGQEAGGHIGQTSSMSLIPQIVDAVDIPVIGAGGVGDGRSIVAMYALGAQGVQAGTIFLATEECPIARNYKEEVVKAGDQDTIVTGRSYRGPVRSLSNDLLVKYIEKEYQGASQEELLSLTEDGLANAVAGDLKAGVAMCGEVAGMIKEIKPVKETIEDLFQEAEEVLQNLSLKK